MIEWQFEHFKTFTPYEILQQAAAVLMQYEGENTDGSNPQMRHLTDDLIVNTGHPAWMPDRDSENLNINMEGSVFRNKARLFSSFLICVPPDLLSSNGYKKSVVLTDFGKALALGKIDEENFYRYIIKKFQYPHLAFSDYEKWVESGITIRPLICIGNKNSALRGFTSTSFLKKSLNPCSNNSRYIGSLFGFAGNPQKFIDT